MSAVWKHFTVSEKDGRMAVCRQCSAELSRGGTSGKTYSTTSLIYHLKSRHPEQYAEYEKDTGAAAAAKRKVPPSTPTPSVADFSEKAKKFAKNSAKAKGITKMIMEFIALDDQPFSVVEDVGFRRLIEYIEPRYTMPSRRYFSDVCLPEMYNVVSTRVHGLLATDIAAFSFTTDIWSSDVSPTSMLSLTAQWIDTDFKLQKVVLHSQEFRGSHTAEAISEAFTNMFDTWRIDRSKVHAVVSDDTRNMAKAMEDSDLKGIRCMAHTIQLAVNEGVMSQCSIADVIAIGRKIVGHFKHSPLAYARLQSIQEQFAMPPKRLQQDVSTRWSSTYYMLESLFAQKRVLAAYIADYDLPATFTAHQWVLIQNVLSLLAPFEQLTKEISSSEASVADVIPFLAALKRLLNKEAETDHGVKTTKSALFEAVNTRFSQAASEPLYCIATVLDPRYKEHYLDVGTKQRTREMIQAELDLGKPLGDGDGQGTHGAGDGGDGAERKMSLPDEPRTASLSDMFDEILQENNTNARPRRSSTAQQLDDYLSEVPIPRSSNPLEYWRTNQGRFPDLAQTARRYLSAPCTSTDSERLFSAASHVLDEKSNRLECGKAEKLLFIKKNLTLFLKKLNVKSTETGSSAPTCDQTVSLQKVTRGDSKDASVSRGARVLRVAEEPEPQMFSTVDVKRRTMGSGIQCPYCRYRCGSKFSFQIHVGSQHPLHCEDVSVGRLGKVVFYQRTAKLFHCHICFYTSKDYAVLFEHLLARHCFSVRKAVQTDKGDEVTDKDDTEVRVQDRSPNPEIKPDNDNTTEQHDHETSNADSLKRKRSSGSRGEDGDEDTNVPDIQAANEEQTSAVEQFSECSSAPYYDCKFCKQRCKSKDSLLRHISCKHDIPKPHACKECSDTFMLESLLSHHVNLHHRQKLYQCPYCLFESSLQGLHQHLSQCRAVERNEDKGDVGTEEKE